MNEEMMKKVLKEYEEPIKKLEDELKYKVALYNAVKEHCESLTDERLIELLEGNIIVFSTIACLAYRFGSTLPMGGTQIIGINNFDNLKLSFRLMLQWQRIEFGAENISCMLDELCRVFLGVHHYYDLSSSSEHYIMYHITVQLLGGFLANNTNYMSSIRLTQYEPIKPAIFWHPEENNAFYYYIDEDSSFWLFYDLLLRNPDVLEKGVSLLKQAKLELSMLGYNVNL